MFLLRQSTASQEVPLGHFVDETDGKTAETGLTIANTDIKIWKTGATSLVDKNSGGATHISGGIYYAVLDATDTNTIGPLVIFVHVAGALPVRLECSVLDEAVYDVQFGTTAPSTYAGGAVASVTGNVGGNVAGSVGSVATGGITRASFAADTGMQTVRSNTCQSGSTSADIVLDSGASSTDDIYNWSLVYITGGTGLGQPPRLIYDYDGSTRTAVIYPEWTTTPDNTTTFAILPSNESGMGVWFADATFSFGITQFGQIMTGTYTGVVSTIPNQISALNNLSAAQVNAEVDTALADINLDHLMKSAVDTDFDTTVHTNSALGYIAHDGVGTGGGYNRTTDSLEAIRNRGDSAWTTATGFSTHTAADVWAVATRTITSLDEDTTTLDLDVTIRAAVGLASANLDTQLDALPTTAEVNAEVDAALADINLDHLVKNAVDTNFDTTVHANSVVGQLAHDGVGTGGGYDRTTDSLEAIRNRGDSAWTTATGFSTHSAADVWAVATRTITSLDEDTVTLDLDSTIRSAIGLGSANLDAQLDNIPTVTELATEINSVQSDIAALNDLSAAEVNAEVDTALADINLDHLVKNAVDTNFDTTVHTNSVMGYVSHNGVGTGGGFDRTTDSLEAIRDRGDAAWVTGSGTSTLTQADVRTAVGLASANLDTQLSDIQSDTDNIQTRLPAALVGGRMDSSVGAMAADTITSTALDASAVTEIQSGLSTLTSAQVNTEVDTALSDVGLTTTITGRIDTTISSRLAGSSYTAPLDAAGTRTAVGLASANLDTQLGNLPTLAEILAGGDIDGYSLEEAQKIILAAVSGILSGGGTTTISVRAADNSKVRITATVDDNNNRTAVTLDATG